MLNEPDKIKFGTALTTKLTSSSSTLFAISDSAPLSCDTDNLSNKCSSTSSCNKYHTCEFSKNHSAVCNLWHQRLGLSSVEVLRHVLNSCKSIPYINKTVVSCSACHYGKSFTLPYPSSHNKTKLPLELIQLDIWGPAPITSAKCYKYYITFIDDYL